MSLPAPSSVRNRLIKLHTLDEQTRQEEAEARRRRDLSTARVAMLERVTGVLEDLSQTLFQELVGVIEAQLTKALQEVLEQPIALKARLVWKHNAPGVDFEIERAGHPEDIMRGQGGSVTNILSVGLRMFALATLDPKEHRPFLVLNEQDCWLKPELVPRLVKIIHDAGRALGFQILLVSHHDVASFREYANRIYRLVPGADGAVSAEIVHDMPVVVDGSLLEP